MRGDRAPAEFLARSDYLIFFHISCCPAFMGPRVQYYSSFPFLASLNAPLRGSGQEKKTETCGVLLRTRNANGFSPRKKKYIKSTYSCPHNFFYLFIYIFLRHHHQQQQLFLTRPPASRTTVRLLHFLAMAMRALHYGYRAYKYTLWASRCSYTLCRTTESKECLLCGHTSLSSPSCASKVTQLSSSLVFFNKKEQ